MGLSQKRGVEKNIARMDTQEDYTEALGGGARRPGRQLSEKEITCHTDHRHPDDHRRKLSKDCRNVAADP